MAELSKAIARLMEERERAQPQLVQTDPPRLREVIELVRGKVAPAERPAAEAFVRQLLEKPGSDLLTAALAAHLAAMALSAYRFLSERTLEEPRIRVFDPDLDREGWEAACSVVETVMRDRPFIVDTIQETLRACGATPRRLLHPVLGVERDVRGTIATIAPPSGVGRRESFVHMEVERVAEPEKLRLELHRRLGDVVLATDDYQAMRAKTEQLAEELRQRPPGTPWNADIDEVAEFLRWLGDKNFVFLGYREYDFMGRGAERSARLRRGTGLGILRKEDRSTFATVRPLSETLRRRLNEPPLLLVSKTNAESPVHRAGHMDYVGVKEIDSSGVVVGERRLLGLLTSKAYAEESASMPLLRRKLAAILEAEGAIEDSYSYKAIVSAFDTIPKVELLATPIPDLRAEISAILAAATSSEVTVLERADALGRGVFVVVMLPRERFSNDLQRRIESRLSQALSATVLEQRLVLADEDPVRMHFYLAAPPEVLRAVPLEELRGQIGSLLRTWDDRLEDQLGTEFPRDHARQLAHRYTTALSTAYKAGTDVAAAVGDIRCIEALLTTGTPQVDLLNEGDGTEGFSGIKLYLADEQLVLSDFLPVLENLGLRVFAEQAMTVTPTDTSHVRIHTFLVRDAGGSRLDVERAAGRLKSTLLTLHAGQVDNDPLNALVLQADLDWRQVDLLRTYVNHGVQIGTAASREALIHAVVAAPQSARLLWDYFEAKFDPLQPTAARDRLTQVLPALEQRFVASLDAVQSVAEDRMLRALFSAVSATVRTNYFAAPEEKPSSPGTPAAQDRPEPALAVKIACAQIPHLPRPYPLYEVYVHGARVEAVHLRGAKVARGGIRLSDRPDDFRTEILDLMKTQMVKNAVIVPAGAKGGFVPKHRLGTPLASGQIVSAYRTFIAALLGLTDNIVQGRLVHPPALLLYDDPDPYLVVAADKGTATFSDIANTLAAQYRFWLGDAFASGGEHGYDHKREGITARGAWECVRRHFREMGRDADREPLTVIGIGDMSGDVFGNGLLLSRRFVLRAAFNHAHIFVDPNPDPARSYAERERLFRLPRSSWSDYSSASIGEGGGVFSRTAKKIPLSAGARAMLGLETDSATGEEVVRAILRMDADLLWNGGIGTYVKAGDETHAAVGDSANDAVRVNANELRVRVVAEGGNLGFTQRARIEYALAGGRINTDAIDNSAGVDMSDHEVNLKIALADAVESGALQWPERNQLLTGLAPDISRRVLAHNRRQARTLSLDQLRSQTGLNDFRELMLQLEADGVLDRQLEGLPDRDTLRNRRSAFLGLTRPELAVLLAHSKLALQRQVLASALPDDPYFESFLRAYFPDTVEARFGPSIRRHRLRREIITVEVANALIDTMGAAFASRVGRDTGTDAVTVVRAWALAATASGATALWQEVGDADPPLPPVAEMRCWTTLEDAVERATKWIIETQPANLSAPHMDDRAMSSGKDLLTLLPHVLPPGALAAWAAATDSLAAAGTPRPLAERIVPLGRLAEVFEIDHLAAELDVTRRTAAGAYYGVGEVIDLEWVQQSLGELPAEDRWQRRANEELRAGLVHARRQLTRAVLGYGDPEGPIPPRLEAYVGHHQDQLVQLRTLIGDIKSARRATLASMLVVMRTLGRLAGRKDS